MTSAIGVTVLVLIICATHTIGRTVTGERQSVDTTIDNVDPMHPQFVRARGKRQSVIDKTVAPKGMPYLEFVPNELETHAAYWINTAQHTLGRQLQKNRLNKNVAKNVIMFLGDGMSIPTMTATRVYVGGESEELAFEKFPYAGLSKTYCANVQVSDSACTATAYLAGVKANYGTIGVSAAVGLGDCHGQNDTVNHVESIAKWAQDNGMLTGFVTTTTVTNASPAGIYAHTANRNWENDAIIRKSGADPEQCHDIAKQLVYGDVGRKLNVIMGGGRVEFLPVTEQDTLSGVRGRRGDGQNLIEHWLHEHRKHKAAYVETRDELLNLNLKETDHLMALFAPTHVPFHLDANAEKVPTLAEMVNAALNLLDKSSKGYFLFVEGGRIDHGHHGAQVLRALDETAEFAKAVDLARARTDEQDTLIVVTADHSHTMSISGYSSRGNDILGINDSQPGVDGLPYPTISYANGPGYNANFVDGERKDLHDVDMHHKDYRFPSTVPLNIETHGGDDVAVFASGPWAHLFTGTFEQHFIPHAMAYAACIGHHATACSDDGHNSL